MAEVIAMAMRRTVDGENLIETIERCLLDTMHDEGFCQAEMAATLNMSKRTINYKMQKLLLRPKDTKLKQRLIAEQEQRRAALA